MNIFEDLKSGESVDMVSEECHLNHVKPQYEEWSQAFNGLFDRDVSEGHRVFSPTLIMSHATMAADACADEVES